MPSCHDQNQCNFVNFVRKAIKVSSFATNWMGKWLLFWHAQYSWHLSSVPWHCCLGDRKGIQPVKGWVLVYWWWRFDRSFAHFMLPIITTTSITIDAIKSILVLAYPGCPGKWLIKWVLLLLATWHLIGWNNCVKYSQSNVLPWPAFEWALEMLRLGHQTKWECDQDLLYSKQRDVFWVASRSSNHMFCTRNCLMHCYILGFVDNFSFSLLYDWFVRSLNNCRIFNRRHFNDRCWWWLFTTWTQCKCIKTTPRNDTSPHNRQQNVCKTDPIHCHWHAPVNF